MINYHPINALTVISLHAQNINIILYRLTQICLELKPYNLWGRGVGTDHQVIDHNSKMALSSTSKLGDFCFYLLDTFWQDFSKIDLLQLILKPDVLKNWTCEFFVLLQNHGNAEGGGGYKFLAGKKVVFLELCLIPGGKYWMAMTCSILESKFLWHHISKSGKADNLKFYMFTGIICTIISDKFQINPLTVTLFPRSGPESLPPPSPQAGQISKCRRL